MKNTKLFLIALMIITGYAINAQVAVNKDGSAADPSAMLDVKATDAGFLAPRMTQAQIAAIAGPANGLMVYNTDDCKYYAFRDCSSNWTEIALGANTIDPPAQTVYNPVTGETWMDRNLGASQVATSSTDASAYGNLYQWGRFTDGHEIRGSAITSTNATTVVPDAGNSWDGLFITEPNNPYDWLTIMDNTLWQGIGSTNNPCPAGFRLPNEAEWDAERQSWASNDAAGAFGSPLKLTVGGFRDYGDGSITNVGTDGSYWSSSLNGSWVKGLLFTGGLAGVYSSYFRARGFGVRCIQD